MVKMKIQILVFLLVLINAIAADNFYDRVSTNHIRHVYIGLYSMHVCIRMYIQVSMYTYKTDLSTSYDY